MAANKRIQKSSKPLVDGCDGTDCGDGSCCNNGDYPVCCPDSDWCGATADDCPSTTKKLPKMAANKRIQKTSKPIEGCFGTECDDGRCCNNMDYPLCCPGWSDNCVVSWDGCDDTNKLPKMAANKRIQKTSKPVEGCFGTECDDGRCCTNKLPKMAATISTSSPRWLPTRGSRSHPSLWLMDVMEQTVEMAHVAIMVTTLSAVLTVTGVELLLMTALLLPKSSPRWLP